MGAFINFTQIWKNFNPPSPLCHTVMPEALCPVVTKCLAPSPSLHYIIYEWPLCGSHCTHSKFFLNWLKAKLNPVQPFVHSWNVFLPRVLHVSKHVYICDIINAGWLYPIKIKYCVYQSLSGVDCTWRIIEIKFPPRVASINVYYYYTYVSLHSHMQYNEIKNFYSNQNLK